MSHHSYRLVEVARYPRVLVVSFKKRTLVHEDDARDLKADLYYVRHNLKAATTLFDCDDVRFISSSVLGVLFSFQTELQERRHAMALCRLQDQIDMTLRMFGLDKSFTLSDGSELPSQFVLTHANAA